jgi:hypothetical protein
MAVVLGSRLTRGIAWLALASGCTGTLIPGVPLDDAGDEFTVADAAPASVSEEPDASAPASADSGRARDSAVQLDDARTSMPAAGEAGAAGAPRDAAAERPGDAGPSAARDAATPMAPVTPTARDLTTDPTKFAGAARCGMAGVLLCEDFENGAIGAPPDPNTWTAPFGFMPRVDGTRALRGTKSLYFELAAGTPGHIEQRKTFPAAKNTVYGRMFVWVDALPTAPAYAHWTLVSALGADNPAEVRLSAQLDPNREGGNYFGIGSDHGESGDWATAGQEPQALVRARRWICLEWLFKGDTSQTQVWIDGHPQSSLSLSATEYRPGDLEAGKRFVHPTFDRLRIGWWLYQTDAQPTPAKMWIDELAIDDERIGCAL